VYVIRYECANRSIRVMAKRIATESNYIPAVQVSCFNRRCFFLFSFGAYRYVCTFANVVCVFFFFPKCSDRRREERRRRESARCTRQCRNVVADRRVPFRYETIRYDTIRYDTIRYDTIRYDTIRYDTIRSEKISLETKILCARARARVKAS